MAASNTVGICNQALGWVGGNLITSLDDNSKEAQLCKANFEFSRDAVLEEADWTFALKRYKLIPNAEKPLYAFGNGFTLPPEVIRVISVSDGNDSGSHTLDHERDWQREGDNVIANEDVVWIKALTRVEDTTKFSPGFRQSLATRLAAEFAIPISRSRKTSEQYWILYQDRLAVAMASDGLQGRAEQKNSSRLINIRRKGVFSG